jgi:hypothetical protein
MSVCIGSSLYSVVFTKMNVQSRKLSKIGQSLDGWPKIYYLELLRASEGTLSRKSWLHLQSLAPTNPHWARVVGYGLFSLCVIHKKGLWPCSGDINVMMMMMMTCCCTLLRVSNLTFRRRPLIFPQIHTYIPLTLYPRRGSRDISDILPILILRCPYFTKIIWLWGILQTWQVVSPSPSNRSLSQV